MEQWLNFTLLLKSVNLFSNLILFYVFLICVIEYIIYYELLTINLNFLIKFLKNFFCLSWFLIVPLLYHSCDI